MSFQQWQHLTVSSTDNPKIKQALRLREKRDRDKERLFLVEGFREISRAVQGQVKLQRLFICPELFLGSNEMALIETVYASGCQIIPCAPKVFSKISYRDRPDGLIGVAHFLPTDFESIKKRISQEKNPLIIVAEAIEKPGNLGTILRCADAVRATAVIVVDRCTDIHNPNVVRSSVGTLFTIPVCEASGSEVLEWLTHKQIAIVAATPAGNTLYTKADMTQPIAIALGTEQLGLSHMWLKGSTIRVRIPMQGAADSLNVAMATTVLLFEAQRQRGV